MEGSCYFQLVRNDDGLYTYDTPDNLTHVPGHDSLWPQEEGDVQQDSHHHEVLSPSTVKTQGQHRSNIL